MKQRLTYKPDAPAREAIANPLLALRALPRLVAGVQASACPSQPEGYNPTDNFEPAACCWWAGETWGKCARSASFRNQRLKWILARKLRRTYNN